MKKVVIHKPGSYDRLTIEEHPTPRPIGKDVLIEVKAAGINFADVAIRMGLYASAKEYVGWPITPGFEVSGVVVEVGEEESGFCVGDEVCACVRFGGYASHVVASAPFAFPKPQGMSFETAAGLPTVFLTAWFALSELAHPRPGYTVLVHSAAGGVGSQLIQQSKIGGCTAIGVVGSSHKVDACKALGADHVIDKSKESLWEEAKRLAPEGYDVVFDANGVETLRESYQHLRRAGKLVTYGFHSMLPRSGGRPNWGKLAADWVRTPRYNPLDLTNDSKSVLAFNLSYLFDRSDLLLHGLADMARWLEEGKLKPPSVTTYSFEDVGRAHADLESGKTIGKLVLVFS